MTPPICDRSWWGEFSLKTRMVALEIILVGQGNCPGWPGEFQRSWIEAIQNLPDVRLLFLLFLPTLPPKREYNAVSAVADEVWQYHTRGNLTIFDKDRDTAEEGWSLHTALVGGDLASPRTVAKIVFWPEGGVGSWSWTKLYKKIFLKRFFIIFIYIINLYKAWL